MAHFANNYVRTVYNCHAEKWPGLEVSETNNHQINERIILKRRILYI